ncbi:SusD/RagB family nutrient-binding outer membrane lipoprotein [Chitinophaga lutea]
MTTFKQKHIRNLAMAGLGAALTLGSCTKDFERINTDPYGLSKDDLKADFRLIGEPFKQIQNSIYAVSPSWVMQVQQNLQGDIYSGYMGVPGPFGNGGNNNATYNLVDGWNEVMWGCAYGSYAPASNVAVMPVAAVIDNLTGTEFPDFKAWMYILKVLTMQRVSDVYGPIIYTKYGKPNPDNSVDYDSQKDAYYAFFADLEKAINILTPLAGSTQKPFERFDITFDGTYKQWLKFANSLRLRMAIRISKIDPAKAKTEGEAALANAGGLLETPVTDDATIDISPTPNPYNTYSSSWNDIRMGAPMESILKGYKDPRIGKYFVTSDAVPGQYKGIRTGIALPDKIYADYSKLAEMKNEMQLMTAAEVWFLRAEAAIRGWAKAGDAKTNYENGVKASFAQHGAGDPTTYLADNTSKAAPYVDTKNATNSVPAGDQYLSTVTIRWEEGDAFERKLERIITQKWIAMFPDGQEAWSEYRRTGYPKLFPVVINNSGGKIPTATFIRRINFVRDEYSGNPKGVQGAITKLGGPDTGGTRLWWDKP